MQWYNSLSSLAEDERVDEIDTSHVDTRLTNASDDDDDDDDDEDERVFTGGRVQVTRTRSLMEKNPVRITPRTRSLVAFLRVALKKKKLKDPSQNVRARPLRSSPPPPPPLSFKKR